MTSPGSDKIFNDPADLETSFALKNQVPAPRRPVGGTFGADPFQNIIRAPVMNRIVVQYLHDQGPAGNIAKQRFCFRQEFLKFKQGG
jgi:hypothetical protein